MMREFRFRAWWQHDKYNPDGAMYGVAGIDWTKPDDGEPERELCDMPTSVALVDYPYEVGTYQKIGWNENCELMQYTGLKDKNGVEIYESDIVEGGFEKHRGVVSFGLYANPFGSDEWTGYQGFYIKWSKEHAKMIRGDMGYWTNRGMETAIRVIGNIYENPELLTTN